MNEPKPYASLKCVLDMALDQASGGKGHERHASGEPFTKQPMFWIEKEFPSFQLGQAVKKIHESQRLEPDAAKRELLGAINYLAAHCIFLGTKDGFERSYDLYKFALSEADAAVQLENEESEGANN